MQGFRTSFVKMKHNIHYRLLIFGLELTDRASTYLQNSGNLHYLGLSSVFRYTPAGLGCVRD